MMLVPFLSKSYRQVGGRSKAIRGKVKFFLCLLLLEDNQLKITKISKKAYFRLILPPSPLTVFPKAPGGHRCYNFL